MYYARPSVVLAQLKERPEKSENLMDQDRYRELSGTFPPDANSTLEVVDWNIGVYRRVADSGQSTFQLSLVSNPPGANVATKQIGDKDYTVLGQPTNISEIKLEFSIWTFKFSKPGCRDYVRQFDPIKDPSAVLQVELSCGGR